LDAAPERRKAVIGNEELSILISEIQTAKTKAQTALTMAEALRVALAVRSADFEGEYVKQLESLLESIPTSMRLEESLRLFRVAGGAAEPPIDDE
jgi:hypothetical protein